MAALLAGKSACITGGVTGKRFTPGCLEQHSYHLTGIGRAIALGYLHHGAAVTVNFLDDEPSWKHFESLQAEAPKGSRLHGVTGDIGKKSTGETIVQEAVNQHGSLDIYVANAGVSQFRDFVTYVYMPDDGRLCIVTSSNVIAGLMKTRSMPTSTPT